MNGLVTDCVKVPADLTQLTILLQARPFPTAEHFCGHVKNKALHHMTFVKCPFPETLQLRHTSFPLNLQPDLLKICFRFAY